MTDSRKPRAGARAASQPRAVREPISSIWADLIPSEPELDELELDSLRAPNGPRTSPAWTMGSLERPSPASSVSLDEPRLDSDERRSEPLPPPTIAPEPISDDFDSFEALDAGIPEEKRREMKSALAERRAAELRAEELRAEELRAEEQSLEVPQPSSLEETSPSESAERFTEPPHVTTALQGSWILRFPSLLSALVLALLLGLGVESLTSTPLLEITGVELTLNGSHVTREMIEQALAEGGRAQNILTYDHDGFVARLEALPWVKRAEVVRSFPDALKVVIHEHEAAGVVVFRTLYAVNRRGELLAPISPEQALALPLISGVPQELFSSAEGKEVGRFLIRRGLKISALYHELELDILRPLSEVHVSETGYVELILKRTRVTLGNEGFERHLEDLRELLLALKRKGVDAHYILLSSDFTRAIIKEAPLRADDEEPHP